MSRPDLRMVVTHKDSGDQMELGAAWQSEKVGWSRSLKLGGKTKDGTERKVYLVVEEGGKKTKVSTDTHFINLVTNTPRQTEGADTEEEDF